MMYNEPIEITITNSTITIFKNYPICVSPCPPILEKIYNELRNNKEKYFKSVKENNIFRNFECSKCYLNKALNEKIDRVGWILWSIWWIIKFQPAHFFLIKDILSVALFSVKHKKRNKTPLDPLPLPPWIKKRPKNIQTIYNNLQKPIYHACC